MVLSVMRHSIAADGRVCSSSKDEEQPEKKKKRYLNSIGQQFHFHHPSQRDARKRERDSGVIADHKEYAFIHQSALEAFHLDKCISEFHGCKCSRKGGASSCFLNMYFDTTKGILDRNAAMEALKMFRGQTQHKTEKELTTFTETKFLDSVTTSENLGKKLNMKYVLDGMEVCRESFCFAYSITAFQMKKIAKLAKTSKATSVKLNHRIKKWKDDHVHNFTMAESREVFVNMVAAQKLADGPNIEAGKFYASAMHGWFPYSTLYLLAFCFTVAMEMARAALTPTSQAQQVAIAWLEDYAARHGDDSPTREEIHLSAMRKTDIYIEYKREFSKEHTDTQTVNLKKFLEIWNAVFPHVLQRPYVSICGKCITCYEIEDVRHTSTDARVQWAAQMAHHLHRGGLFMLERAA